MKKWILMTVLIAFCTTGCMARAKYGSITAKSTLTHPDGTIEVSETTLINPKDPKAGATVTRTDNGFSATISGSQSRADLAKVKGQQRNKGMLYGGCALLLLLGGVALALPNQLVSNKDALMVLGAGGASIAVVMWVDAAAGVMKWVIPAVVVFAVVYIGWLYIQNKKQEAAV